MQRFELHNLEWPHLVLILCGAGLFLTTLASLHLRYSGQDPVTINTEAQKFGWWALGLSSLTFFVEYWLLAQGYHPRGASLL